MPNKTFGLYIHWPFCQAKCPYCDFNVHIDPSHDGLAFAESLIVEMASLASRSGLAGRQLTSIFFGGGTPSLMPIDAARRIIAAVGEVFIPADNCEITLEVNPTRDEADKLHDFCRAGINRLSLGMQSLTEAGLCQLGRQHSLADAKHALGQAQAACNNVSADFIYARPAQTLVAWQAELQNILALQLSHLALYQLTIEAGTAFHRLATAGRLIPCAEGIASQQFDYTQLACAEVGLAGYEVSNHAQHGYQSQHNLLYWQGGDWLGIGPGAVGRFWHEGNRIETRTRRNPKQWQADVARLGAGLATWQTETAAAYGAEALMMGLRLTEGVCLSTIAEKAGDIEAWLDWQATTRLIDQGLLDYNASEKRLAISPKARRVTNAILREILPTSD